MSDQGEGGATVLNDHTVSRRKKGKGGILKLFEFPGRRGKKMMSPRPTGKGHSLRFRKENPTSRRGSVLELFATVTSLHSTEKGRRRIQF